MTRYSSYQEFYSRGPYAPYLREHRLAGSTPLRLLHIEQPAGDFPDPPLPEYFLYVALRGATELSFDWGCGRWSGAWHPGDVSIAPPDAGTDIHIDQPHAFLALALPKTLVGEALEELVAPGVTDLGALHAATFRDTAISRLMLALWEDADRDGALCKLHNDGVLFGLLSVLARSLGGVAEDRHGLDDRRLKLVLDYIETHLGCNLSLGELAAACGLSPMHFARQFRRRLGASPYQYVLGQRLKRARALIGLTAHPLAEIAAEIGFSSQSHLTSAFTRRLGVAPGRFRSGA